MPAPPDVVIANLLQAPMHGYLHVELMSGLAC